ncbi:MAG: cytochrome C oxidase subunit IV family protein [Deltaproteobacteria bacterium]|nr:cytochrome C oxidase subunit IV family protein [Deltaproteobacteria bacterium]MBI2533673.1 cytochrome C oxidase subunit IV family protein [Deltaproteobacteria bacterium]MBI3064859.1 cytochrome C oxidase subunit IV family protein [Deltaproteobacteria bacterium]
MMSNAHSRHYLIIWVWLLALVVVSVAAVAVLPKFQALLLIFAVAIVKAWLVARNYMHLKNERVIIYVIVLIPLTFVIILLFALFPDFVYRG